MDTDRQPPHRTTSTSSTSDLFICFTSRHHSSSSSMKISSKSILKTSRSMKGGASPAMFPPTGKKRSGAGFDNPEPSSPKVTCIGQVRVKSKKKHGKKLRSLSRRHSTGDVSFRKKLDGFSKSTNLGSNSYQETFPDQKHNNNTRWVHLPLTICEALRAFGSEFSCLFPCRSSCSGKEERVDSDSHHRQGNNGSCAAVFTRWLVAFPDGVSGRRDVDGDEDEGEGEEEYEEDDGSVKASRRHVFDDLEIVDNRIIEGGIDEGRVSICIPPKNALLLMRCRSDPLKMEALANRLWAPTIDQDEDEDEDEEEEFVQDEIQLKRFDVKEEKDYYQEYEANQETILKQSVEEEKEQNPETNEEEEEESSVFGSLFDEIVDQDQEFQELQDVQENDEMEDCRELFETQETETEESNISNMEKVKIFQGKNEEEEMVDDIQGRRSVTLTESKEREELPECLLLMMYEPKLSMEVSKETWVSSKDFIRRHSSRKKPPPPPPPLPPAVKHTTGQNESKVSTTTISTLSRKHVTAEAAAAAAPPPPPIQPGRSSCSLPRRPPSMAEMLEQKLVNAVGYEPFVLTRCKSEPMRTAAAKLAPDTCFWKNRKLEPLRRASFGVGAAAAGIGF